jgi:hypothetical protein
VSWPYFGRQKKHEVLERERQQLAHEEKLRKEEEAYQKKNSKECERCSILTLPRYTQSSIFILHTYKLEVAE